MSVCVVYVIHVTLQCNALVFYMQESMTALMLATQRGHKDIVKALVERKADPNITADKVGLCLHVWIMYHCSLCITDQLLDCTAFGLQRGPC